MLPTKTKKITLVCLFSLSLLGIFFSFAALAADPEPESTATPAGSTACTSSVLASGPLKLQVPILQYTQSTGIAEYIKEVYQAALYILVPISIVIIILAGFFWVTAGGDQGRIRQSKQFISSTFWGLALALLSYTILSFVGLGTIRDPNAEYIDCVTTEEFGITYTDPVTDEKKGADGAKDSSIVDEAVSSPDVVKNNSDFIQNITAAFNQANRQPEAILASAHVPDSAFKGPYACFPVEEGDIIKFINWNFGRARQKKITDETEATAWKEAGFQLTEIKEEDGTKYWLGPSGSRCHVGVDIYTQNLSNVYSILPGRVMAVYYFYNCNKQPVYALLIKHGNYTINYGELSLESMPQYLQDIAKMDEGLLISQTDQKPYAGRIPTLLKLWLPAGTYLGDADNCGMLHFEIYKGATSKNINDWGLDILNPRDQNLIQNEAIKNELTQTDPVKKEPNFCRTYLMSTKPPEIIDPTNTLLDLKYNFNNKCWRTDSPLSNWTISDWREYYCEWKTGTKNCPEASIPNPPQALVDLNPDFWELGKGRSAHTACGGKEYCSHYDALEFLIGSGIEVTSSSGDVQSDCTHDVQRSASTDSDEEEEDPKNPECDVDMQQKAPCTCRCTSLEQIPYSTISNLSDLRNDADCPIEITGGTEECHQSHGWEQPVVDLAPLDCIATICNNKEYNVSSCLNEGDHYHVVFNL